MPVVYGSPFAVNWSNFEDVCTYADKLGPGQLVYKHPDRNNYNITHSTRWKEINPAWVLYETKPHREY